jgi:predicted transcriptional regulator
MTALTVRLPNSVHQKVRDLAVRDDISVNQFIASAVSEKMASVLTLDFLKQEAAKGSRPDFENFLRLVPDTLAQAGDERVSN